MTGHDAYREPFEPLVPGVSFAQYNDLDSVKALMTDKTCAIILEPLQVRAESMQPQRNS